MKIQANFDRTALAKQAEMYPRIGARALNETAKQARTFANKRLREVYNIRQAALNKEIKITPALSNNSGYTNYLVARISLRDRPIGMIKFFPKKGTTGVNVEIKVGSNKTIRGGFIATMSSGHEGVFVRTGKKVIATQGRYQGKQREQIEERFTLSAADMFGSKQLADDISKFIDENLPRVFASKMKEL